mmetsp:Transcript_18774/g.32982  ORF Transcript_18774/g.32982 Transcript_18774/m.32982 type:complete len:222 (-) Transcript_18774:955-1620(-)
MATDHWDVDLLNWHARDLMHELVGSHNVQGGHAANLARVQALLLIELAHGWHHGVHRIHDQAQDSVRAVGGTGLHDVLGDASVDAQEIRTSHARLAWQSSWHKHEIAASEALLQLVDGLVILVQSVGADLALPLQVPDVSSHTLSRHHGNVQVVDAKLTHQWVHGHQHAKWLTDASGTTANADLEVADFAQRSDHWGRGNPLFQWWQAWLWSLGEFLRLCI